MSFEPLESSARSGGGEERRGDPGASRNGNFINYYQFHPAEERLAQLPREGSSVWHAIAPDRKYVGLDVGCNAGELTFSLHDYLENRLKGSVDVSGVSLLGIDLDPVLIERAVEEKQRRRDADVSFDCVDFMSPEGKDLANKYLRRKGRRLFDAAFCFSITMWIHLNHGDLGLEKFLKTVCELSRVIVVEPQPWKCYKTASRRLKRANVAGFPLMEGIRYRNDMNAHVQNILADKCGFEKLWESDSNGWGRKILIYERK